MKIKDILFDLRSVDIEYTPEKGKVINSALIHRELKKNNVQARIIIKEANRQAQDIIKAATRRADMLEHEAKEGVVNELKGEFHELIRTLADERNAFRQDIEMLADKILSAAWHKLTNEIPDKEKIHILLNELLTQHIDNADITLLCHEKNYNELIELLGDKASVFCIKKSLTMDINCLKVVYNSGGMHLKWHDVVSVFS